MGFIIAIIIIITYLFIGAVLSGIFKAISKKNKIDTKLFMLLIFLFWPVVFPYLMLENGFKKITNISYYLTKTYKEYKDKHNDRYN